MRNSFQFLIIQCIKKQNRALRGADSVDFNRFGYPSVFNHRVQFRGFFCLCLLNNDKHKDYMRVLRYLDFLTKNLYSLVINILFLKKKN